MGTEHQHDQVNQVDPESQKRLRMMTQRQEVIANRIPNVRFVLVVLSAKGVVFDLESLRQKIMHAYPDSAIFFQTTYGMPVGLSIPDKVDLLIDFTGPGQRQGMFHAWKLKKKCRFAVGRNAGLFRKKIYDRVFDEISAPALPSELLQRERFSQKAVLELAGISLLPMGETPPDLGKSIALELPGYQKS